MKITLLYSGGKDSNLSLVKLLENKEIEVKTLITIIPKSVDSFMFHFPNVELTELQAQALELPIIKLQTFGEKEKELEELKKALIIAKEKFGIEGVASGAIKSRYQKERVDRIAKELNLFPISPLWGMDEEEELKEVIKKKIRALIVGVFAEEIKGLLGKEIEEVFEELKKLKGKINISGEGGEYETFVFDSPLFKRRIRIMEAEREEFKQYSILKIKKAILEEKI
ncbi:MAG: diphthine--ammonia ligase [Candidatus Micrarchaeia archaeon]|jgi:ABC transporter with metal-binding/Fe-S-binding domain ATP-binding protein